MISHSGFPTQGPVLLTQEVYHLPEFAACDVAVGEPTLIPASGIREESS